jgi:hypothetical protein
MRNVTETVKHLLIINGIFFLATLTLGDQVYDWFALHYPENPKFEVWQPLTHMFMHGDISHIFFNMFGLWMFGTPLEQMWGKQKFIFFYISTGFGAAALQLLLYYYQVDSVNSALNEFGLTAPQISSFYKTAELPTAAISEIGERTTLGCIQCLSFCYGRCVGSALRCFGGFCDAIPQCSIDAFVPPHTR